MKQIKKPLNKIIGHLDLDAFFAAVEERNSPIYKGKPIVVGADPKGGHGRGVVSTANYLAREYGIHSAMPISQAWLAAQKAKSEGKPEVVFMPSDFPAYQKSSHVVFEIIKKYSVLVEQASIDEFYFDLTLASSFLKAQKICVEIKKEIKKEENLTCSVGIGSNKLIAKIAAGFKKPNGLFAVSPKESEKFLEPMSVKVLPGVGPKTAELLQAKNIFLVKDLKKISLAELENLIGKWGRALYSKARGVDDSLLSEFHEPKSISEQNTFEQDTFDIVFISSELEKYCRRVFERFKKESFKNFKTIAIVVRFSDFSTFTSAKSFKESLGLGDLKKFQLEALKLLLPFLDRRKNPKLKKLRLLGVRIENFSKML